MDIEKYKEFADKLFDSGVPKTEGVLKLNAFDPCNLKLYVNGKVVYGYTPDTKFLGVQEEFEINLQFTGAWAFAFLEHKGETVTVLLAYKDYYLFKSDMKVNSSLKFEYEIPTVNVKFKKV